MMPKYSNNGFAFIPVLVLISLLSISSFAGYKFYNSSSFQSQNNSTIEDKTSENVLAAFTGNEANSFLFKNLFNKNNSTEFNTDKNPVIVSLNDKFESCSFFPRAALSLNFRYKMSQLDRATYNGQIFQNVSFLNLSGTANSEKYLVVIPGSNASVPYKTNFTKVDNQCNPKVDIFKQPSPLLTSKTLSSLIDSRALDGMPPIDIGGTKPTNKPGGGTPPSPTGPTKPDGPPITLNKCTLSVQSNIVSSPQACISKTTRKYSLVNKAIYTFTGDCSAEDKSKLCVNYKGCTDLPLDDSQNPDAKCATEFTGTTAGVITTTCTASVSNSITDWKDTSQCTGSGISRKCKIKTTLTITASQNCKTDTEKNSACLKAVKGATKCGSNTIFGDEYVAFPDNTGSTAARCEFKKAAGAPKISNVQPVSSSFKTCTITETYKLSATALCTRQERIDNCGDVNCSKIYDGIVRNGSGNECGGGSGGNAGGNSGGNAGGGNNNNPPIACVKQANSPTIEYGNPGDCIATGVRNYPAARNKTTYTKVSGVCQSTDLTPTYSSYFPTTKSDSSCGSGGGGGGAYGPPAAKKCSTEGQTGKEFISSSCTSWRERTTNYKDYKWETGSTLTGSCKKTYTSGSYPVTTSDFSCFIRG